MCQWTLSYLQPPGESPVASGHLTGYSVFSVLVRVTEVFTLGTSSVCHMYYRLQNEARVSLKFRLIWFVKILLRKKKYIYIFSFSLKTCLCVIWKKMSSAHLLQCKQEFAFSLKGLCHCCLVRLASIANYTSLLLRFSQTCEL